MDQEIVNSLRQAASDIKEGKMKPARESLVALLRDHPEIDQAWYMLSFTVPVVERQIYALEQALKVNPGNEKALSRLQKLQGEPEPPKDSFSFKTSKKEEREEQQRATAQVEDGVSGDDLLSRRLLGGDEEVPESQPSEPVPDAEPAQVQETAESASDYYSEEPEEEKPQKEDRYKKKVFGMRRSIFMLGILILIFFSLGVLKYTTQIRGFIAGMQNNDSGNGDLVAVNGDSPEGDDVGASTEEPTEAAGIDLPPIWTPTPTMVVEPTEEVVENPAQLSGIIIDFSSLPTPDEAMLSDFETIRLQLSAMMADAEIPAVTSFIVSENELQTVLSEFARRSEYRSQTGQIGQFFAGLGMVDSTYSTDSLMQNMWADPNGTLAFLDSGSMILTNFEVSQYQRFSYAKALVQNYRSQQISFGELGIFPMCSPVYQECEILFALTKGEAGYFADLWATEYLGETAFEAYSQEGVNFFTVSEDGTPASLEAFLAFPDDFGRQFVEDIFDDGGLETLQGVYLNLPATTEQLMHPDKYRSGEPAITVEPTSVTGLLGAAWQEVFQGTLGEWKTYLMLTTQVDQNARIREDVARVASTGWGGDHAQIFFRNSTQEFVVVAEWAWDTPADTTDFLNALTQLIRTRTGATRLDLIPGVTCYQSSTGVDCVFEAGREVVWLHAPDQETIGNLLSAYS